MDKWQEYETQKRKLRDKNLSPTEYEREISELCANMKL